MKEDVKEMKDLMCLRCHVRMDDFGEEQIQLGKTGWILGDLPNLFAGAMRVKLFRCPRCGKLELFSGDGDPAYFNQKEEPPRKICPECGAEHDAECSCCPICGYTY